jgi:hypothetical protein
MCLTPLYTNKHKTKKNKPQTQHNMCLTPLYPRRRKTNQKHNTLCVWHHFTQDVEKQTKNTTLYVFDTTIYKQTKDEEKQTTNTTQYVFDTTLCKT